MSLSGLSSSLYYLSRYVSISISIITAALFFDNHFIFATFCNKLCILRMLDTIETVELETLKYNPSPSISTLSSDEN